MSTVVPIIRQDGEGEQMWFAGGGVFTCKATAAETAEAFVLLEDRHVHPAQDESLYVLEGELLVDIAGEQHRVREGGFVLAPRVL